MASLRTELQAEFQRRVGLLSGYTIQNAVGTVILYTEKAAEVAAWLRTHTRPGAVAVKFATGGKAEFLLVRSRDGRTHLAQWQGERPPTATTCGWSDVDWFEYVCEHGTWTTFLKG